MRPNFQVDNDNAPAVAEICSRLEGIPLAIELAAARVRLMPPQEILDALGDHLRVLTGGGRTAMPRQKTLEASVAWSFALLTPAEQTVFSRLSVFAGSFTLDAAENVCGFNPVSPYEVLDIVSSLVDKSLVQVMIEGRHGRYRLLETIRQYAARRVFELEETSDIRSRHARFFLDRFVQAEPSLEAGDEEVIARLEAEADNLRASIEWIFAAGDPSDIVTAGWALALWGIPSGRTLDVARWVEEAVAVVDQPQPRAKASAFLGLGIIFIYRTEIFKAHAALEEGVSLYRSITDEIGTARATAMLAYISFLMDGSASNVLEESLRLARQLSDRWSLEWSLGMLGIAHFFKNPEIGRRYLEEALGGIGARGGGVSPSFLYCFLAWGANLQGRFEDGYKVADEAARLAVASRNRTALPFALTMRADALVAMGRADDARLDLADALRIAEETQDVGRFAQARAATCRLNLTLGNFEEAGEAVEQALAIVQGSVPHIRCMIRLQRCRLLVHAGSAEEARAEIEESLAEAESLDLLWGAATARNLLSRLAVDRGTVAEAEELTARAISIFQEIRSISGVVESLELLGEIAVELESWPEAARLLSAAEALRRHTRYVAPSPSAPPFSKAKLEQLSLELQLQLGDAFESVSNEGAALSVDAAVEYATRGRGERKRPSSGWASLTPVELQVAQLVSEGLTNPQIGERLFISKRTVQGYVSRILAKLSLSSRSEVAARVAARAAGQKD